MDGEDTPGIYLLHFDGGARPCELRLQNVQTGRIQRFDSLESFVRHLAGLEPFRSALPAKAVSPCD